MRNNILHVLTASLQISARIEYGRILDEDFADAGGHAETKVRVNVDLADCAACCLTKLIFRNTDCILKRAAVCIDDLDIFLRDGGSSVQDDREARKPLGNLIEDIEAKLRLCARLKLVSTMAGSDCDGQRINAGLIDELFHVLRIRVGRILSGNIDIILNACQRSKLCLDDNAALMSILDNLARDLDVLLERLAG